MGSTTSTGQAPWFLCAYIKKKHDILLIREQVTKSPIGGWKLESGKIITTEKAKFIGKFKGKNCYGIISEKLEAKVGSSKFDIF